MVFLLLPHLPTSLAEKVQELRRAEADWHPRAPVRDRLTRLTAGQSVLRQQRSMLHRQCRHCQQRTTQAKARRPMIQEMLVCPRLLGQTVNDRWEFPYPRRVGRMSIK